MTTDFQASYCAHELSRLRAADGVGRLAQSLHDAQVDLNPHQIDAALFALRSPAARGVLLADEVGLGKTIEAGVVLCQFWAERKRRLLVICPASLRKQWAAELEEKFGLPVRVVDARARDMARRAGVADPLEAPGAILILSYDFAARVHDILFRMSWDLAVVDEAHKLRNVYKSGNVVAQRIRRALTMRRKILLTATPLQNSLMELYGLATLIDDHQFGDADSFRSRFMGKDADLEALKARLRSFCWRSLRGDVQEYIRYTDRQALTLPFSPTDAEQRLHDGVTRFLQRGAGIAIAAGQRALISLVLFKLLASSSRAIAGTLDTLRRRLRGGSPDGSAGTGPDLFDAIAEGEDIAADTLDAARDEEENGEGETPPAPVDRRLDDELAVLDGLVGEAQAIGRDSKADALIKALEIGFAQMAERGARRKALVFTESRRTQEFLLGVLTEAGHAGRIVLFNGGNTDPHSQAILGDWQRRNRDSGRVTGSRPVDMRMALVEAFRDDADIMIATEAAAEGMNLQFCSLVINYDLPWNPQRIEQRIGRCHRYGQKHDVVVINFLNQRNPADQRVLELLEEKFKLFKGVFGASDEVLGSVESGIDFEMRILRIHRECRSEAEIDEAFAALRAELDAAIRERIAHTRLNLLAHFDEDVHARLRLRLDDARLQLDRTGRLYWMLARYVLDGWAELEDERRAFRLTRSPVPGVGPGRFHLPVRDGAPSPPGAPVRLSHPLGAWMLERGRALPVSDGGHVRFLLSDHPTRISPLEALLNRKGWLSLHRLTVDSFEREEFLVFSAIDNRQQPLDQELCEKLFLCPAVWRGPLPPMHEFIAMIFAEEERKALDAVTDAAIARNRRHFDEERARLDAWAEDRMHAAEKELADTKNQIKVMTRQGRQTADAAGQLDIQRRIQDLERAKRRLRQRIFDVEDDIVAERDRLIATLEGQVRRQVTEERLFTIHWEIR